MNDEITKAQERASQYWFVDGLAELAAGSVSLFLAVLVLLWQVIFMWRWSLLVIGVAGLAFSFGLRLVIQRIKERTTYVRTGYASPFSGLESKRNVVITAAFTLLLLGANYWLTTKGPPSLLWSPGMAGLAFAVCFAWVGALTKLRRFYSLALLSICVGITLAILGMDYFRGLGVLAGVVGLVLLYQGYLVRKAYISQSLPLSTPTDE
ncbi:MAG: hypothetical protein M0Z94_15860 [Dehalococcoidales bacterium]|nr:hypothetical protein [Dehalococcoidales bacterium]